MKVAHEPFSLLIQSLKISNSERYNTLVSLVDNMDKSHVFENIKVPDSVVRDNLASGRPNMSLQISNTLFKPDDASFNIVEIAALPWGDRTEGDDILIGTNGSDTGVILGIARKFNSFSGARYVN